MAVVQNPIIGRARNKMGNVIFQKWKDKNVMRSAPLQVHNPNTFLQARQRQRMKIAVQMYRPAGQAVKAGFIEQAIGMSEYNAFTSHVLLHATPIIAQNPVLDPDELLYAKGSLPQTPSLSASEGTTPDEVSLTWDATPLQPGHSNEDKLYVVVYNEDTEDVFQGLAIADRGDESAEFDIPVTPGTGEVVHVYAFFVSENGRKSSDSQHFSYTA